MNKKTNLLPEIFSSELAYRKQFMLGLEKLLESGDLNLFILVCANATSNQQLYNALKLMLETRYQILKNEVVEKLQGTGLVDAADDDLLVFLKIIAIGLQNISPAQVRTEAYWEIQYNQLRAFRPLRNAARRVDALYREFDESAFHFNKVFMQQETIWTGEMLGMPVDLYYNKFPFVDLHALLVLDRSRKQPQYLEATTHHYIWSVTELIGQTMPGLRIAYNAFGAFASVNHLHFQLCVRSAPFPVELTNWIHNGGDEQYPIACMIFEKPEPAWEFIRDLHEKNQTYNLIYTPGKLYCMPRKHQGKVPQPGWSPGLSWYELSGGFITFDKSVYNTLTDELLRAALTAQAL